MKVFLYYLMEYGLYFLFKIEKYMLENEMKLAFVEFIFKDFLIIIKMLV